ncbi:hypothetical protein R3P38DRAFT_3335892 [Favolaschia claudopus]|uniref:Uncharacterized protein n=1 Tax=Favolaschia claudopus TaxID=2862362 RepID=A0AAV9Z7L8_9AGAR
MHPVHSGIYPPPNYPPSGFQGHISNDPVPPRFASTVEQTPAPHLAGNTKLSESEDAPNPSTLDFPIGYARREHWDKTKWVWRSRGDVWHNDQSAEVRNCQGVFRCGGCDRLTQKQIRAGCTNRTSRVFRYLHYGDHSTHRQGATAHELRTGDINPGLIPLADISPTLANPKSARYAVGKSQARLGITSHSAKGGLASIGAIGDLEERLPTPFIIASSLAKPTHITFQTPVMDEIIGEMVDSWLRDYSAGPTAGHLSFFQLGTLLATCAYSMMSNEWTVDAAHHRPHFAHLFKAIIKHAGARFERKLLLSVNAIISTIPSFSSLSRAAQAAERQQLVKEAEEAVVGCEVHFWRSADRIKKTHYLVPPKQTHIFEDGLRELISPNTTLERFNIVVQELKGAFPRTVNWFSWWDRGSVAAMIFPARRTVPSELVRKVPSTTNPIEHQHSLLHHGVGKHQELIPGIEKLYLHVREMEKKHTAINVVQVGFAQFLLL